MLKIFLNLLTSNLGKIDDSNTRYTNNVTVKDCTFSTTSTEDVAAVKSYTGGDWNLNISGCTANEGYKLPTWKKA